MPHTRDALVSLFWLEADQEHERGALHYTIGQLKAALGDSMLQVSREQLGLLAQPELIIDVAQFRAGASYQIVTQHVVQFSGPIIHLT